MAGPPGKGIFKKKDRKPSRGKSSSSSGGASSGPSARGGFQFKDRSGKVHGVRGASAPSKIPSKISANVPLPDAPAFRVRPKGVEAPAARSAPAAKRTEIWEPKRERGRDQNRGRDQKSGRKFEPKRGRDRDSDRDRSRSGKGRERPNNRGTGEAQLAKATVDKNRKGFGFLIFENRKIEDAFIPPTEAEKLFHGDRVEVSLDGKGRVNNVRILQHRFRELVGRFNPHPMGNARGGWVVYERKRAREEVFIPRITGTVAMGDWIRAKLVFHEKGPHAVTAEIVENFGQELPPSADVAMVAAEYNLVEEHSESSEKEAKAFKLEVPGKDLSGRVDLRETPFITIDGETARDFDDAVYVERKGENYILWVAIADVSHYVTPGSALDQEAFSRGTSVYFPERAFHMLPRALSESLCSLKPKEPRLAMVAKMEFDSEAKRHSIEIMEAVIFSQRRATYTEIAKEWEENKKNPNFEYLPHFELYQALRKMRLARGSIDFEFGEAEMNVHPNGEVEYIRKRDRNDAHKLIEEFMIAANEAVTEWALARDWPFIYRVHDEPAAQSLEKFQTLAATVGVHFTIETTASPKVLADIVRRLSGSPAQDLLNMALLRSMKQAVYSSTHGGHFGLASQAYTHFTSPIRRYPDLAVHRMLRKALRVEKKKDSPLKEKERVELEKTLTEVAEHCSYRERLATDAERESIKLKQVRLMTKHLGDEFDAKIIGMTDTGLFVQVDDPFVEGMITKDSMADDMYEFNEDRMIFYGRRKKRTFKIGGRVKIRVLRADIDKRQIDFGMVEAEKSLGKLQTQPLPNPAR